MFTTNILLAFKVLSRGSGVLSQVSLLRKLKCLIKFINLKLIGRYMLYKWMCVFQ